MRRYKFIINPQSDRGHTAAMTSSLEQLVDEQARQHEQGDYEFAWAITEYPRHAIELAHEAAIEHFDVVIAVGGDGTVHEVVNGLMQVEADHRPMLGILPVGTGNDFAFNTGIPSEIKVAVCCLFDGCVRTVDIGTIRDGNGRIEYWDNSIGIGFSGAVNIFARSIGWLRGFLLYLIAVLQTILLRPMSFRASYRLEKGTQPEAKWLTMVSLCNGPREGGGFPLAPDAKMDDGQISYVITNKLGRLGMLYFLPIVMSAKHLGYKKTFEAGLTDYFHLQTETTMPIHADGEVFSDWESGVREVEVGILPDALRVLCCENLRLD